MFAILRRHLALSLAFAAMALLALGLLGWAVTDALNWDHGQREPVAGWMTVGYVARSWNLDPREIDRVAGLPLPQNGRPFTLNEIAADRGVPVADIVKLVEDAIVTLTLARPGGGG